MIRLLAACLLVAALALLGQPAPTQADAAGALANAGELVRQARAASEDGQRSRLAREALVALAGEPSVAPWDWLRAPLESNPPDLAVAQERLDAATAALSLEATAVDARHARTVLQDVLADRRFNPGHWHDLIPGWLLPAIILIERLLELVWNIVRWPFDRLLDLLGDLLRSAVMVPVGILFAIAVMLLYRGALRSALVRQAEISKETEPFAMTAMEALGAAQRAATLGHYREASHFVLISTLLWVEEHEAARFDPSATNREHLRRAQAAARPAVARALAPLVATFDTLWYGTGAVTEADYRSLLDLASRVRETTI